MRPVDLSPFFILVVHWSPVVSFCLQQIWRKAAFVLGIPLLHCVSISFHQSQRTTTRGSGWVELPPCCHPSQCLHTCILSSVTDETIMHCGGRCRRPTWREHRGECQDYMLAFVSSKDFVAKSFKVTLDSSVFLSIMFSPSPLDSSVFRCVLFPYSLHIISTLVFFVHARSHLPSKVTVVISVSYFVSAAFF